MGLDVGDKRIGVALSDALGILASPLRTLERRGDKSALADIARLVETHAVEAVVVGLPKRLDNTIGIQAEKVTAFAEKLRNRVTVPVILWDERLTTAEAARLLPPAGASRKRREYRKHKVDQVAAVLLLESYLTRTRSAAPS
jgi:putative Holliday junction resolvase